MRQTLTRRPMSAVALAASIAVAGLSLSAPAFAQDPTTEPLNQYTSTTPTVPPTQTVKPTTPKPPTPPTTPKPPTPPPTSTTAPTTTSGIAPTPPTATTAAAPNTPPKRLALTGYDPLIVGFAGLALMLGAFVLQRRRGAE